MAINLNHIDNSVLIGTSERVRIDSDGYVGINSTTPRTHLDVRGNFYFHNNMLVSNWDSNGSSGTNIDHIWHSDASNYGRGGTWNFVSDAAAKVTGNSSIQIGFLKSSGGGHLLGDVGIGTTTPNGRLHISSGTANSDCLLIIESDTDNNDENSNPQIWFKQDGDITGGLVGQTSNKLALVNNISTNGGISFRTGSTDNTGTTDPFNGATEKFFITPGGRLVTNAAPSIDCGVGGMHLYISSGARDDYSTSADALIIEKNGDTGISIDPGSSGSARIYFPNESNHSVASISHDNSTGEFRIRGEDHIILSTNNNIERFKIDVNGHVNIGGTNEVQLTATNHEILHLHGAVAGADVDHAWGLNIDMDDDNTGTTTSDRERGCIHLDFHGNCTGGDTTNETRIWNIHSDVEVSGDYDDVRGFYSDLMHSSTSGTTSNLFSIYGYAQRNNAGAVSNMYGVYGVVQNTTGSSGTVNDMVGVRGRVNLCAGSGAGTSTDIMGIWANIDNDNEVTQGGGKCYLYYGSYDKTTGLNNPYGVYITTDVPNYFSGEVRLGTTTSAGKLTVDSGTSNTCATFQSSDSGAGVNIKDDSARSSIEQNGTSLKISSDTGAEHANSDIRLQVDGATKMLINSDGDVGINNTDPQAGAKLDVRGVTFLSDDIGSVQPSSWANHRQLIVYTSTNGQPIGNTDCARVLIATDAKQTGAQGYHGSIDFGSSDCSAANGSSEYNWRTAAIMCRGDGDTSPSIADGDLQFWTKSASGTMSHRFDIAPNGDLTATDTVIGQLSDQRLKTNIQDYSYDLDKFKQLKTRTFDWINPEFHQEGNIRGFIAQEIETVDPYWNYQFEVSKETAKKDYDLLSDGDENYTIRDHRPGKASKLNGKDAMYVSVIQQLMSKIETLEAKVTALEGS